MTPIVDTLRRLILVGLACVWGCQAATTTTANSPFPESDVVVILDTAVTVIDQPIHYPATGTAQVTSAVVTLEPGQSTGFHRHLTPMYGVVLEGTLTVDYGTEGERVFEAGDALMEAVNHRHEGRNDGDQTVRVLVVNMGAEGIENTVMDPS